MPARMRDAVAFLLLVLVTNPNPQHHACAEEEDQQSKKIEVETRSKARMGRDVVLVHVPCEPAVSDCAPCRGQGEVAPCSASDALLTG